MSTVWVGETVFEGPELDEEGDPIRAAYVDGVAHSAALARRFGRMCAGGGLQWQLKFLLNGSRVWRSVHQTKSGVHFHEATEYSVATTTDRYGWPA